MHIIGINRLMNSSAVLVTDGRPVFAIQEERLSKIKNDSGFPALALQATLEHVGLQPDDIAKVCVAGLDNQVLRSREDDLNKFHDRYRKIKRQWFGESENPFAKFAKDGVRHARRGWLGQSGSPLAKLARDGARKILSTSAGQENPEPNLDEHLAKFGWQERQERYDHHLCHAAAAYYGLARDPAAKHLIFSMDGGGDGRTSAVFVGENGTLTEIATSDAFSPACLYGHITYIMGFMPHEHEYKLMGLAPYAQPRYAQVAKEILAQFIGFAPDHPLTFDNTARYPKVRNSGGTAKQELVHDLFKATLNLRFDTLAAGLQLLAEEVAVKWIKAGIQTTGIRNVLLTGGFFMNVKANQLIADLPEVESVNCFPSCGDETLAFGAAFLGHRAANPAATVNFASFCLGTEAGHDLATAREKYREQVNFEHFDDINGEIVELLLARKIVARCSGPMEFGARALGNRSIIAAPDDMRIINVINAAIKKRDFWMPFAPAISSEHAAEVITIPASVQDGGSPYMMFTFAVKPGMADRIIAGVHQADKTARAQLVAPELYPDFHDIISRFHTRTGIPAVLNTSFNLHGFPIVLGACDAIDVLLNSELDVLVVEHCKITKK